MSKLFGQATKETSRKRKRRHSIRRLRFRLVMCCFAAVLAASGCTKPKVDVKSVSEPPLVHLVQPQVRNITRTVGQPSFVEAYERTSIYPKLTGYIEKWNVDIGDKVKKGDVLATLFVPEIREDWQTKKDTVKLDEERVSLAQKSLEVADAEVEAAQARLTETEEILAKFQAQVDRWDSEVKRLKREVDKGVVDPQVLLESTNQWKESIAARNAAKASILKAKADLLAKRAAQAEAKVYVDVSRARVTVAKSDAKRLEAWVGYLTLPAPFDGVISARNANTFDFVLPATGDPTADARSPYLSPSGKAAPIYVVDRTDIVRIFVDIPEGDANYVHGEKDGILDDHPERSKVMWEKRLVSGEKEGSANNHRVATKAKVLIQAYKDEWIPAVVTRTSWALNVKSRTLRAEVDLPNSGSMILPGMYAYGKVIIERPHVRAVPTSTLVRTAEKTFVWLYKEDKATLMEVRTGVSDGEWTEVTSRQPPPTTGEDQWTPIDGSEQVIVGDLSVLTNGSSVRVADEKNQSK